MNAKLGFTLAALAALCLLAAPAFSMPGASGGFKHEGNCPMIGNLTAEQMGNMTLGELKELMKQSRNNSTSCPMGQGAMNCGSGRMGPNMGGNDSPARGMDMQMGAPEGQKDGRNQNGRMMGGNDDGRNMMGGNMNGSSGGFGAMGNFGGEDKRGGKHGNEGIGGSSLSLLWYGDITLEKLGDMTVNQIRELKQSWMEEMDGMTLSELDALKEKKIQEMNNMTVNEISEMRKNNRQISRIVNSVETAPEEA